MPDEIVEPERPPSAPLLRSWLPLGRASPQPLTPLAQPQPHRRIFSGMSEAELNAAQLSGTASRGRSWRLTSLFRRRSSRDVLRSRSSHHVFTAAASSPLRTALLDPAFDNKHADLAETQHVGNAAFTAYNAGSKSATAAEASTSRFNTWQSGTGSAAHGDESYNEVRSKSARSRDVVQRQRLLARELGRPVSFGGGAFSFGEMLHVANSPKVEVMTVSQAGSDAQAMSHFGLTQKHNASSSRALLRRPSDPGSRQIERASGDLRRVAAASFHVDDRLRRRLQGSYNDEHDVNAVAAAAADSVAADMGTTLDARSNALESSTQDSSSSCGSVVTVSMPSLE